jgi:hypothetical protein
MIEGIGWSRLAPMRRMIRAAWLGFRASGRRVFGPNKALYSRFVSCAAKDTWLDRVPALAAGHGPPAQLLLVATDIPVSSGRQGKHRLRQGMYQRLVRMI